MSSHSEHGTYVRFDPSRLGSSHPADTAHLRNGVVNNLNHLLDEDAQVLASLSLPFGSYYTLSAPSTSVFKRLDDLPPLEVPLRLSPDGGTLKIVTQLRAYASAAGTITFRIRLSLRGSGPVTSLSLLPPDPAIDWAVAQVTTASTTPADLAPAVLQITSAQLAGDRTLDEWLTMGARLSGRGDGSIGYGRVLPGLLEVWAKSTSGSAAPRVAGFMAREYGG